MKSISEWFSNRQKMEETQNRARLSYKEKAGANMKNVLLYRDEDRKFVQSTTNFLLQYIPLNGSPDDVSGLQIKAAMTSTFGDLRAEIVDCDGAILVSVRNFEFDWPFFSIFLSEGNLFVVVLTRGPWEDTVLHSMAGYAPPLGLRVPIPSNNFTDFTSEERKLGPAIFNIITPRVKKYGNPGKLSENGDVILWSWGKFRMMYGVFGIDEILSISHYDVECPIFCCCVNSQGGYVQNFLPGKWVMSLLKVEKILS